MDNTNIPPVTSIRPVKRLWEALGYGESALILQGHTHHWRRMYKTVDGTLGMSSTHWPSQYNKLRTMAEDFLDSDNGRALWSGEGVLLVLPRDRQK